MERWTGAWSIRAWRPAGSHQAGQLLLAATEAALRQAGVRRPGLHGEPDLPVLRKEGPWRGCWGSLGMSLRSKASRLLQDPWSPAFSMEKEETHFLKSGFLRRS